MRKATMIQQEIWQSLARTTFATIRRTSFAHDVDSIWQFLKNRHNYCQADCILVLSALEYLYHTKGQIRVSQLAECANLSLRQFERRFKILLGISPKRLARLIRFEAIRDQLLEEVFYHPNVLAYTFGYTDEAHFIHDFKKIAGMTPSDFVSHAVQRSMTGFYKTPDPRIPYPLLDG
jgi:AraC-like DNA-binding protein